MKARLPRYEIENVARAFEFDQRSNKPGNGFTAMIVEVEPVSEEATPSPVKNEGCCTNQNLQHYCGNCGSKQPSSEEIEAAAYQKGREDEQESNCYRCLRTVPIAGKCDVHDGYEEPSTTTNSSN